MGGRGVGGGGGGFKWAGPADLDPKAKPAILIFPLLLLFNFASFPTDA